MAHWEGKNTQFGGGSVLNSGENVTEEKLNPVAHAAGKHRKGSNDAHVPLTSQAQVHTAI